MTLDVISLFKVLSDFFSGKRKADAEDRKFHRDQIWRNEDEEREALRRAEDRDLAREEQIRPGRIAAYSTLTREAQNALRSYSSADIREHRIKFDNAGPDAVQLSTPPVVEAIHRLESAIRQWELHPSDNAYRPGMTPEQMTAAARRAAEAREALESAIRSFKDETKAETGIG